MEVAAQVTTRLISLLPTLMTVAATLSVGWGIFLVSRHFAVRKEKKDQTIAVWMRWSSKEMHEARHTVDQRFKSDVSTPHGYDWITYSELLNIGKGSAPDTAEKRHKLTILYSMLSHFFMEVSDLKSVGHFDDKIFDKLFLATLERWHGRFMALQPDKTTSPEAYRSLMSTREALKYMITSGEKKT